MDLREDENIFAYEAPWPEPSHSSRHHRRRLAPRRYQRFGRAPAPAPRPSPRFERLHEDLDLKPLAAWSRGGIRGLITLPMQVVKARFDREPSGIACPRCSGMARER